MVGKVTSNKPKRPGSAFLLFSNEMRGKYKAEHPTASVTETSAALGEIWKTLGEKEKEKFGKEYQRQKSLYDADLQHYMEHRTQEDIALEMKAKSRKHKNKDKKVKDPNQPKRPLSAYMFFAQEVRPEFSSKPVTEQAKALGARWSLLNDHQKEKYNRLAEKDKKRYQDAMVVYRGH